MMKKVSDVFKSIRFATIEPKRQGEGHKGGSTDDEGHYTVGEKEYGEQLKHVKKRAGQEVEEAVKEPTGELKDACWKGYTAVGMKTKNNKKVPNCVPTNEAVKDKFDIGEYDQEGDMAKSDLRSIIANAQKMHDMLDDADNLPEWVQSKITKAEDYISTVANYMTSEMNEESKQIDEAPVVIKTNKEIGAKVTSIGPGGKETNIKTDSAYAKYRKMGSSSANARARAAGEKNPQMFESEEHIEEGMMKRMVTDKEENARMSEPPFDKPYTTVKKVVTDKSGAKHTPMSRARDLARQAAKKQAGIKQESTLDESRQLEIVKEAMKAGKKKKEMTNSDDKFQADPELNSQIVKVNQSN